MDETTREYWIIDWLARHGPEEWHGYVERHQWDGASTAPLELIVAQPECDAATAATIFWMAEPSYYLGDRDQGDPMAQLLLTIAARWSGPGFTQRRFAFHDGCPELLERINAGPAKVPVSLAEPIEGTADFMWFDDLPPEIDIAWHRANGREPPGHLMERQATPRAIAERPGRVGRQEAAMLWAKLGPTSAFPPLPSPKLPPQGA